MVNTKTVISALALSAVAAAAPAPTKTKNFSVNQVAVNRTAVHPVVKYAKALSKYGIPVPANVAAAAAAAVSGSATNTPSANDREYVTPVQAGDSNLNLDFDTGSSDLWVYTSSTDGGAGHTDYVPSSSGQKLSGATWKISYGDGSSASGDVYQDTVVVAGVTATSQAVEAAETVSGEFSEDTFNDGLLGLGFSNINTVQPTQQQTFFENVQDSLDQPLFAVVLKHQAPGTYDFGFIDSSKYTGEITYTDVDSSQGWWQFTVDGYSIGSSDDSDFKSKRQSDSSFTAIADTGTTIVLLDSDIVDDYYSQIESAQEDEDAGGYVFDCDDDIPDFNFFIGDYTATIPGSLISMDSSDGQCFGGIQSNSGEPVNVLGDVFLKSQYAVFSADGPKIGFAPQV